jgi:hypothetical protein
LLDYQVFPEQAPRYSGFLLNEKMIVNLIQCLIHCGHSEVAELVNDQCALTYQQIEFKSKFRNKGLYYLLSLFEPDVEALVKRRAAERKNRKIASKLWLDTTKLVAKSPPNVSLAASREGSFEDFVNGQSYEAASISSKPGHQRAPTLKLLKPAGTRRGKKLVTPALGQTSLSKDDAGGDAGARKLGFVLKEAKRLSS